MNPLLNTARHRAQLVGKVGLAILFASTFSAPAAANAGVVLVTIAFPFAVVDWRSLVCQPVVMALLACIIYLIALTVVFSITRPEGTNLHWSDSWDWLQLALFIPMAFFVRANSEDLGRLLLFCILGLIIGALWRLDWAELLHSPQAYFYTRRDGYGSHPNEFALFSGTALLGMVLLRRRWWADGSPVRTLLWIACLLLLLQAFLVTKSRGPWFSILATIGFVFILSRHYRDGSTDLRQTRISRYAVAILVLAVLAATQGRMIVSRLLVEIPVVQDIVSGKQGYLTTSSFALRWNAQIFGVESWLQRPLTGWGPKTSQSLMKASGNPKLQYRPGEFITHLHNTYLELLVQTGTIGLILAGVLIALLLRGLVLAFRADRLAVDLYLFLLGAFVFLLLFSLFEYRSTGRGWRFYWILLAGTAFSFSLSADKATDSGSSIAGKSG